MRKQYGNKKVIKVLQFVGIISNYVIDLSLDSWLAPRVQLGNHTFILQVGNNADQNGAYLVLSDVWVRLGTGHSSRLAPVNRTKAEYNKLVSRGIENTFSYYNAVFRILLEVTFDHFDLKSWRDRDLWYLRLPDRNDFVWLTSIRQKEQY